MTFVKFILLLCTLSHRAFSLDDKFTKAVNCFSLKLMAETPPPNGTGIISAFSVYTVLNMLAVGARGNTFKELNSVLQNEAYNLSMDEVKEGFRSAMQRLTSDKNVTVDIANAMWTDQNYPVNADYKKTIQNNFMAEQRSGDFKNNSAKATSDINDWVKSKTKSMIEKLFDKNLPTNTIMVLLNAIYFKGEWLYTFPQENTRDMQFYNGGDSSKPKTVQFMNQKREFAFKYDPEMKAKIMRMDYTGKTISYVAFLPDEGVKLVDCEKKITCDTVKQVLEFPTSTLVDVSMPKYETASEIDLNDALKKLGLNLVFDFEEADLSGIGPGDLALTKILQKAKIKFSEEGTVAAAATGGTVELTSFQEKPRAEIFLANRPFCYFIIDRSSGLILFGGKQSKF